MSELDEIRQKRMAELLEMEYQNKLRELRQKYYKSARGDKFYTWGSSYYWIFHFFIKSF